MTIKDHAKARTDVDRATKDVSAAIITLAGMLLANAAEKTGTTSDVRLTIDGWGYSFEFHRDTIKASFVLHSKRDG